jgi:tRNA-splicing ligase RtcB
MAVMPDVHPAGDVAVGCVLGIDQMVYPQAIGGDIGCGMSAVRLRGLSSGKGLRRDLEAILVGFNRSVNIITNRGRELEPPARLSLPAASDLAAVALRAFGGNEAMRQLGTLGRGNHFVELQSDSDSTLWLMVHSGSRAMGQAVASHYLSAARRDGIKSTLLGLPATTASYADYLHDQNWCVEYARVNRAILLDDAANAVRRALGATPEWSTLLDTPHNFVRVEEHAGEELVVHRKGAAPAFAGQAGLIPGSAGTMSVHVEGRGDPRAMCSSSHGAGRVLSRHQARLKFGPTEIRSQMREVVFDRTRERQLRDESPRAYRDLRVVLESQTELVKVTRTLRPLVSFKAGG